MEVRMKNKDCVELSSVEVGQCFIYQAKLCMKVSELYNGLNCVSLTEGRVVFVPITACVEVVSAYVVVE